MESNWNKRQKVYLEKIKSGSLFEVASVYRDLYFLRTTKGLSFGEQQVFDNAHKLIVSEIAESKGVGEEKVVKMLNDALTN
jgi:CarD family transcriptional regulator